MNAGLRPGHSKAWRLISSLLRQDGFTLLELIVVMMIAGVLAVAALPRMLDKADVDRAGALEEIKSALQFARKTAIYSRRYVCVTVADNVLTLMRDPTVPESVLAAPDCSQALDLPVDAGCAGKNKLCPPPASVNLSMSPGSVYFYPGDGRMSAGAVLSIGVSNVTLDARTGFPR